MPRTALRFCTARIRAFYRRFPLPRIHVPVPQQSLVDQMLMKTLFLIHASASPFDQGGAFASPFVKGGLRGICLALLLFQAFPAFPAESGTVAAVATAPGASAPHPVPDSFAFQLGTASGSGNPLYPPSPADESGRFRSEFKAEYPQQSASLGASEPTFLLQRGEYGGSRFNLLAEMGDIRISQTPNTVQEASGRGGRMSFLTRNAGNAARFETFAASGAHGNGADDMLVGATGEISFLEESARFKTIYLSGRQSLDTDGRGPDSGARKGDVLGFLAVLDPFQGKLAAEAEIDYSMFDGDTADDSSAVRDSACRVKLGGGWGRYRYSALYEKTGPQYRLMANHGPKRDSEGVALGLETAFQLHGFDLKLSRYNDNTEKSELYPRLYRYEGFVDYTFKGFKAMPLALQYRKSFIDSTREPLGALAREVEEDAVQGRLNYLAGKWDLGLRGGLSLRTDRLRQQREASTTTLAFLPKFAAGPVNVVPDFSLKRIKEHQTDLRTDHYAVNLGVNGSILEQKLDYEVKGGFKKESTGLPGTGRDIVGAKVKAAYPLARLFKWSRKPSVGIRGEYKGINNRAYDRRESDFSLLISLDGGSFL